jgi:hypothetical protein
MTEKEVLLKEINETSDALVNEVLEYLRYLKSKALSENETALLSEEALADGWLGKDEDEAWIHP